MNVQQIIDRAIRLSHTDSDNYTNTMALEDLNLAYQELVDEIVSITKGDYFWDTGKTTTAIWQSEYVAEKLGLEPNDLDIKKINKVFIKYTDGQEYPTQLKYVAPTLLEAHPDYYKDTQPTTDPFFYIQDNSIFIYPAPTEVVNWWLELFVIHKPADLAIDWEEADIEIPTQFHKVLSDKLMVYIYESQNKINESQVALQNYDRGIDKMTTFMKARYNNPVNKVITNLDSYR